MSASAIRALLAAASRPEVVSLAGGMPNLAFLPSLLPQALAAAGRLYRALVEAALARGWRAPDDAW